MIIDAHCHVWETWPYDAPVPDPATRARAEQVLFEMDAAGVEHAVIICARLGDNPRNVDYAFDTANRYPGRFTVFPDLDCRWSPDYRKTGAAARLRQALSRWDFKGFTHYLDEADDGGWLNGPEGQSFFDLAADRRLVVSMSAMPHQMPAVMALAKRHPGLPILCHHHGFLGPRSASTVNAADLVVAAAGCQNIYVKVSGMGNLAAPVDEFPYPGLADIPTRLKAAFGPERLVWGSDYPVSRRHMTYRQTLSMVTRHGPYTDADRDMILSGTMARLLGHEGA